MQKYSVDIDVAAKDWFVKEAFGGDAAKALFLKTYGTSGATPKLDRALASWKNQGDVTKGLSSVTKYLPGPLGRTFGNVSYAGENMSPVAANDSMRMAQAEGIKKLVDLLSYGALAGTGIGLAQQAPKMLEAKQNIEAVSDAELPDVGKGSRLKRFLTRENKPEQEKVAAAPEPAAAPAAEAIKMKTDPFDTPLGPLPAGWLVPAVAAGVPAAMFAGDKLVDWVTDRARNKMLATRKKELQKEFETLMAPDVAGRAPTPLDKLAELYVKKAYGMDYADYQNPGYVGLLERAEVANKARALEKFKQQIMRSHPKANKLVLHYDKYNSEGGVDTLKEKQIAAVVDKLKQLQAGSKENAQRGSTVPFYNVGWKDPKAYKSLVKADKDEDEELGMPGFSASYAKKAAGPISASLGTAAALLAGLSMAGGYGLSVKSDPLKAKKKALELLLKKRRLMSPVGIPYEFGDSISSEPTEGTDPALDMSKMSAAVTPESVKAKMQLAANPLPEGGKDFKSWRDSIANLIVNGPSEATGTMRNVNTAAAKGGGAADEFSKLVRKADPLVDQAKATMGQAQKTMTDVEPVVGAAKRVGEGFSKFKEGLGQGWDSLVSGAGGLGNMLMSGVQGLGAQAKDAPVTTPPPNVAPAAPAPVGRPAPIAKAAPIPGQPAAQPAAYKGPTDVERLFARTKQAPKPVFNPAAVA